MQKEDRYKRGDAFLKEYFEKYFEKIKSFIDEKAESLEEKVSEKTSDLSETINLQYALTALGIFFILVGISGIYMFREGNLTEKKDKPVKIVITSGMNAKEIGSLLESKGVIANSNRFWLMAKLNGDEKKFMAARYNFHEGMKTEDVLAKLKEGEVEEIKFVIPEGFTVKDIAKRLQDEGIVRQQDFLAKAETFCPFDYIEKNPEAHYYIEGFLFPATYRVTAEATTEDILKMMADAFDERLTNDMRNRAKELNLSVYELVTLASLVEKEAKYKEDQAVIAQVFFKRLEVGMPLQSDATLQYLMDAPKEDVTIDDTKMDSPYNTYQNYGLPPGPIANPGLDAINAVLYPADTDYLYFVADRDGHNHFTDTYSAHLDKVSEVR